MFFRKIPRPLLILVILVGFGLLRGPFEDGLRRRFIEERLLLPPPGHTVMQQMGQSALMGTLGGLRSLVATFLVLKAFDQFSHKEWEDLRRTYIIITNLEPRDETHWVSVVWHLGINATASVEFNESIPPFERQRLFTEYATEAVRLGESGLKQIPDSVAIRKQLAEVYREKLKDYCAAARVYKEMLGLPGCPGYALRFYGYFLADCPGNERKAYDYLMNLYRQGEKQRLPTLLIKIKKLETALNIPFSKRIPDEQVSRRSKKGNFKTQSNPPGIRIP